MLLQSDSSGAEQGPSHWTQFEQVERRAGRQTSRQAALQFDGRRKAGPKSTAARKQLELHWGCWGGMTPTGVKEEGSVCGDVRRRKNLVNLTKRLRNRARTVGGRRQGDAKDALFTRGTHTDGFNDILHRTTILSYIVNPVPPS